MGFEVFLIFAALLLLCCGALGLAFFMCRAKKTARIYVETLEDSLNVLSKGLIFFDHEGRFVQANAQAKKIFRNLVNLEAH